MLAVFLPGLCTAQLPGAGAVRTKDACLADLACRTSFIKARDLFKLNQFADALAAYQAAYAQVPAPWLLINIGRAYYRLDQPEEALIYYRRFLREGASTETQLRSTVEQYIEQALALKRRQEPAAPIPEPVTSALPPPTSPEAPPAAGSDPLPTPRSEPPTYQVPTSPLPLAAAGEPRRDARASDRRPEARGLHRQWWFWTITGGIALGAAAAGLGAWLATRPPSFFSGVASENQRTLMPQ